MAAYAALVSLMNTVKLIQNHPRPPITLDGKQIVSLGETVGFLEEFIEKYSQTGGSAELEALERQIASAAHAVEDVIEFHIVDQIKAGSISLVDLQHVIDDVDSVKEKVIKFQQESGSIQDLRPTFSTPATPSTPLNSGESKMVGCDDELIHLMDLLTRGEPNRQIIPIVGMGGIGKTTLARNAYDDLLIVQHFDIRIWVTVSQEYSLRRILLELLSHQMSSTSGLGHKSDDELGEQLYKYLYGRSYLIILDDMWIIDAWDKLKFILPDSNSGSRIVVTTRQSNLATHFGTAFISKKSLDEGTSWSLFCEKAFAGEGCPPDLEEIGKKIARRCEGVPLSIAVIGGLLRKSSRKQEHWESIARDISSILNAGTDEQYLDILSLSYQYLPARLKPCFLYMGIFPEDSEIHVSKLIRLWIAEGFLNSNETQSLEEVAEDHLKDLVDRNLILIRRLKLTGKVKTCYIHDLLRDLCLRTAEKEKFLRIMSPCDNSQGLDMERRLVYHKKLSDDLHLAAPLARSLICRRYHPCSAKIRLLRVLNVVHYDCDSLEDHFQQVNLRYLSGIYPRSLMPDPASLSPISLFWNVQTLLFNRVHFCCPSEIWEMSQLRHMESKGIYLPCPQSDQQDAIVLQNLQTLKTVRNFRLDEEVCKRIPNLKRLKIKYDNFGYPAFYNSSFSEFGLCNICCLLKLESISFSFKHRPEDGDFLPNVSFPIMLKKLSLEGCCLRWEDLTMIGSLPNLEVLKLKEFAVKGAEWEPVEGEFLRLKYLKIQACGNLQYWMADRYHFPILENLVLHEMSELDEIPLDIGEIQTLRVIDLFDCSESACVSALKILEEQESFENLGLQVRIKFPYKEEFKSFREKAVQECPESFKSENFHLIKP